MPTARQLETARKSLFDRLRNDFANLAKRRDWSEATRNRGIMGGFDYIPATRQEGSAQRWDELQRIYDNELASVAKSLSEKYADNPKVSQRFMGISEGLSNGTLNPAERRQFYEMVGENVMPSREIVRDAYKAAPITSNPFREGDMAREINAAGEQAGEQNIGKYWASESNNGNREPLDAVVMELRERGYSDSEIATLIKQWGRTARNGSEYWRQGRPLPEFAGAGVGGNNFPEYRNELFNRMRNNEVSVPRWMDTESFRRAYGDEAAFRAGLMKMDKPHLAPDERTLDFIKNGK